MKLIIGGSFQGKSAYAAEYCSPSSLIADGSTCTQEEILQCDILDHLHLYIRRLLEQSVSEKEIAEQIYNLCKNNPSMCIVCNELGNGVVLLSAAHEDKINFVCKVAKADTKKGLHAGKIIKAAAQVAGGNGGGRPDMAQAGGKEPAKAGEALQAGKQLVQELLG